MMASRRVVRVTDVRVSTSAAKDTLKEDAEQLLADYLKRPSPASVVIFVADELNGNRKITRLLKDNTAMVEFPRLSDAELQKWAKDRIRDAGSEADDRTIRHLVHVAGDDVRRLTNEIEKLSAAALPGKLITIEMVDSLVPYSRELSNFGVTDSLVAGRNAEAIRVLQKLLDDGTEPLALLGLISSNYRRLLDRKRDDGTRCGTGRGRLRRQGVLRHGRFSRRSPAVSKPKNSSAPSTASPRPISPSKPPPAAAALQERVCRSKCSSANSPCFDRSKKIFSFQTPAAFGGT